ncbi:ABC transporter substrate-binding protein [Bacillus marinisedimentorum]|uniref:ABC transporter substrate-binding protein n=1 Tax=Bacillus marinisedimentorum TaxID=1821260 RepID=UPI0007E01530|nr:aliphatic sulfonate ABC transporter substrate-binding protein [Bacillus marinisedimentorum]
MKKSLLILLTLVLSVFISACSGNTSTSGTGNENTSGGSSSEEKDSSNGEMPTVNVAYMPDIHGAAPLVIAQEKGYFKEAGINVNLVKFNSGPPEFQAMAAGDIDIAYIGPGATFLSAQGQGDIIAVDSLNTGDMVLATKKSGVKEVKDLEGKTVGVPKGTSGDMVLSLALENAGVDPGKVNMVNMEVAGVVSAFIAEKVDAVAIWSPYTNEIVKQVGEENIVKLADNTDFFPDYVFPQSWVVSPKYLKENEDSVTKFLEAWTKANDFRHENIEETVKMTAEFTGIDEESLTVQVGTTEFLSSKEIQEKFNDGSAKKWYENLQKLFVKNGKMEEVIDANEFISPEPFNNAVKD